MADVLAAGPDVESSGQALVDSFLERLAMRDNPPPPRNDPASLQQRLGAALRQQLPHLIDRRLVRMAHICYAFFQQASWSAAALTTIVGGHQGSAVRALDALQQAALVRQPTNGAVARYELTAAGEALLLAVGQPTGPGPANGLA